MSHTVGGAVALAAAWAAWRLVAKRWYLVETGARVYVRNRAGDRVMVSPVDDPGGRMIVRRIQLERRWPWQGRPRMVAARHDPLSP